MYNKGVCVMMNSIVTNVIPPDVPSARRGIAHFGNAEPVAAPKAPDVVPPKAQTAPATAEVKANEHGDTFVKQNTVTAG